MTDRLIVRRGYNWVSRFGRLTTIYGSLLFCGATFNHIFTFFSKASLIVSTPMGTTGFIQILKFHVHYHDLVNSYRISKSRMTTICWFSCSLNSGLISSLMTNHWLSNRSTTQYIPLVEEELFYSSGALKFTISFSRVRIIQSLVFCVISCQPLFTFFGL
jgi:hypothetical protein